MSEVVEEARAVVARTALWDDPERRLLRGLLAEVDRLTADLAECYRLTGADPDGNEDWRIARYAVVEVRALLQELTDAEDEVDRLTAEIERRDRELVCCEDCWDAGKRPVEVER
jgi:hypothetical protein